MASPSIPPQYLAILDVGHGNSCVGKTREGTFVVDTGTGTHLLEFLRKEEISEIDLVLISHADSDHISGLALMLASKEFKVREVRLNTDSAKESKRWKNLAYALDDYHRRGEGRVRVELTTDLNGILEFRPLSIQVLSPGPALALLGPGSTTIEGHEISSNTLSSVLRLAVNGEGLVVLAGDIDEVGFADLERCLGESEAEFDAQILVYPHHGGRSYAEDEAKFAERICRLFQPTTVVFSIQRGLHKTPRPEIVEAIRNAVPDVRIACTQLSQHCAAAPPESDYAHLLPIFAAGRTKKSCCAGTMIVDIDGPPELQPGHPAHDVFISLLGGGALCRKGI